MLQLHDRLRAARPECSAAGQGCGGESQARLRCGFHERARVEDREISVIRPSGEEVPIVRARRIPALSRGVGADGRVPVCKVDHDPERGATRLVVTVPGRVQGRAVSAARRLVDLTVSGALDGKSYDGWRWQRELGGLISEFAEVRAYIYDLVKDGPTSKQLGLLASAVAEAPDEDGVLVSPTALLA